MQQAQFYGRCPEGIGRRNGKISGLLYVTFSRPLIGQGKECYIVEKVIEVDELDKGNISAALRKQDKQDLVSSVKLQLK